MLFVCLQFFSDGPLGFWRPLELPRTLAAVPSLTGLSLTLTEVLKASASGASCREFSQLRCPLKTQHQCNLKGSKPEATQTPQNNIFSETQRVIFKLMAWKGFGSHMGIHWGVFPRGETLCHLCHPKAINSYSQICTELHHLLWDWTPKVE